MLKYIINISGIEVAVERKRVKNLRLTVHPPDGRVKISVPLLYKDASIRAFLEAKLPWINKHRIKYHERGGRIAPEYVSGEAHPFLGQSYLLQIIIHNKLPRVELLDGNINLYIRPGSTKHQRAKILEDWYRKQLKAVIPPIISKWENIIGVKINESGIKNMKTRWGSCNIRAKRIWLNLELAKRPLHLLEFIIVHELVHLLERNHNAKFKSYMDRFIPQWRLYKDELNKYQLINID